METQGSWAQGGGRQTPHGLCSVPEPGLPLSLPWGDPMTEVTGPGWISFESLGDLQIRGVRCGGGRATLPALDRDILTLSSSSAPLPSSASSSHHPWAAGCVKQGGEGKNGWSFVWRPGLGQGRKATQSLSEEKRYLACHSPGLFPGAASGREPECPDWSPGNSRFQKRNCNQYRLPLLLYPIQTYTNSVSA